MHQKQNFDLIRLARCNGVGSKTFFELIDHFSSPSLAINHIKNLDHKKYCLPTESEIEKEVKLAMNFGAKIITFYDEEYPELLKEIPDPPPVITVKGKTELLKKRCLAVVGARNASYNGLIFAKKIVNEISRNDFVIVSGLARGIDRVAHEASIENGTIAVIAGGISNIYPLENKLLYKEIFEKGLIISEQSFSSAPLAKNFIQRNRIISGISLGSLLIEAGLKSGSLTTANFAIEQGRNVFAVAGSPYDPKSMGCNKIIKEGAKMTENINDILEEFNLYTQLPIKQDEEIAIKINENPNDFRNIILSLLDYNNGVPIDYLVEKTKKSPSQIKACLIELELDQQISISNNLVILLAK